MVAIVSLYEMDEEIRRVPRTQCIQRRCSCSSRYYYSHREAAESPVRAELKDA